LAYGPSQNRFRHAYLHQKYIAVRPDPYNPSGITRRISTGPSTTPTFGMNFKGYAAVRDSSQLPANKRRSGRGGDGDGWSSDDGPVSSLFFKIIR
jgi:hypothetical protein